MKLKFSGFVSIIIILIGIICLFAFRSVPVTRIWSSYNMLYADKSVSEHDILEYLSRAGCKDVISLSSQRIPIRSSIVPIEPKLNSYLNDRNFYFSDQEKEFNLFYIPSEYESRTEQAVVSMQKDGNIKAGMDGHEKYPWTVPLICIAVALSLLFFAKNRNPFAAGAVFPVCMSASLPFYPVASAVCLVLLALFMVNHIWGRRRYLLAVFTSPWVMVPLITAMIVFFMVSMQCGILGLLVFLASAGATCLLRSRELYLDSKSSFKYELIFSARQLPLMYSRTAKATAALMLPMALLFAMFAVSSVVSPKSTANGLSVPSPAGALSDGQWKIPALREYYDWAWKTLAFPYINLNSKDSQHVNMDFFEEEATEGSVITVSRFVQTENGISQEDEAVMKFDGKFKDSLKKGIDDLDYPAIEKLMKSEGEQTRVAYSASLTGKNTASTVRNGVSLVLLAFMFLEVIFMYLFYFVIRRKKYENNK